MRNGLFVSTLLALVCLPAISVASDDAKPGILFGHGVLSLKLPLTPSFTLIPAVRANIPHELQNSYLSMNLALRYLYAKKSFNYYLDLYTDHHLKVDTVNADPGPGYRFNATGSRIGIEKPLSDHVSVEGAIGVGITFEDTKTSYYYPQWTTGMTYFW